jgi:Flp pilus assembly protein TadD
VNERVTAWLLRAGRITLTLLVPVLVAHGGAIRSGFLYDDYHLIVENPTVTGHAWGAVWSSAAASSRDTQGHGFRPVTLSSYVIDHAVGDGRPAVFHATQMALHAAVMGLVYLVTTALGLAPRWAAASALVVGLHPVQTEAVQYLSARSSVLSTLGLLVAFWSYLRWRDRPTASRLWQIVSLGFLSLAVLSKESAVVGLVWFVAYERLVATESWAHTARRLSLHAATAAASVVPAIMALRTAASGADISTEVAIATGVSVLGRHVWEWIAPLGIEPVWPQPWVGWSDAGVWGAAVLLAAAGALAYAVRGRLPLVAWGVVGGLSALLPVLALPLITNVALFQPHRGYQAAAALAVALAAVAAAVEQRVLAVARSTAAQRSVRTVAWALGAALVVMLIIADARAGRVWRDEVGFWTAAVDRYPSEAAYHQSLGVARLRAGDLSSAADALIIAAGLDPSLPRVDYNLGVVYTMTGEYERATAAYERATERDPSDVKALANLGGLYERNGAADRAALAYRAALAVEPGLTAVSERLARLEVGRSGGSGSGELSKGGP